jgi:hypothetical protein
MLVFFFVHASTCGFRSVKAPSSLTHHTLPLSGINPFCVTTARPQGSKTESDEGIPVSSGPSDSDASLSSAEAARACRARRARQLQSRRRHAQAGALDDDDAEEVMGEEAVDRLLGSEDSGSEDGNTAAAAALGAVSPAAAPGADALRGDEEDEEEEEEEDDDTESSSGSDEVEVEDSDDERTEDREPVYDSSRDYTSADPDDRVRAQSDESDDGDADHEDGPVVTFAEDQVLTDALGRRAGCAAVEGMTDQDGPDGTLLYRLVPENREQDAVTVVLYFRPEDGKAYIASR